ncbi:hypothetical protein IJG04_03280 [Candidatus Saccharibacteria bacterium]|nr:hypothetical protein [Candidatus Saccharibacteria bacterium]
MIQKRDDKKPEVKEFKLKILMLQLDEYIRIHIIPQIPADYKEYREAIREAMDRAWRAMYHAAFTTKRERQRNLVELKIELAMVETYMKEIRDVCYRGKEKRRLDKNSAHRFAVCAKYNKEVMSVVWGWAKNEDASLDSSTTQKTAKLVEKEEI